MKLCCFFGGILIVYYILYTVLFYGFIVVFAEASHPCELLGMVMSAIAVWFLWTFCHCGFLVSDCRKHSFVWVYSLLSATKPLIRFIHNTFIAQPYYCSRGLKRIMCKILFISMLFWKKVGRSFSAHRKVGIAYAEHWDIYSIRCTPVVVASSVCLKCM